MDRPAAGPEDDVVVVHAGLHPSWTDIAAIAAIVNPALHMHIDDGPDERIEFATTVRYCDAHGRRPKHDDPPPDPPFLPWDHFYRGERT